ncbi:MAG: DNA polymerase III subunit delta' [Alphaproteobacteria bacterium]
MARETDERPEWPAPRQTVRLVGHGGAKATFRHAFRSGRMSHAWLITGAEGIGKATFAFWAARLVLGAGEPGLFGQGSAEDDPSSGLFRKVAAGGHPDFMTLERAADPKSGKKRTEIVVDDVRDVSAFLHMTPAESSWRVVVVDTADEMNRNAANALLKILEEPPTRSVLMLVSNAPGALPATIRSRCRRLSLAPLAPGEVETVLRSCLPEAEPEEIAALVRLAEGSPGRALRLAAEGGLDVYRDVLALIGTLPRLDAVALHKFGDRLARSGGEQGFKTAMDLLSRFLVRLVRFGAQGSAQAGVTEGEEALMRRLSAKARLDQWVEVWEKINRLAARADRVNLDRKQVVLSAFFALEQAARV